VNSAKKDTFQSVSILCPAKQGGGVINKDPTIRLDGARPPQICISKYIKIKIAVSKIYHICFVDRPIEQLKFPNSFVQGISMSSIRNSKGGSIIVQLTSCLTGSESAV
jgi:hypothetical protein